MPVPKPSRPSRRERAHALAQGDILDAALRAFARKGYSATKMSDIAAEAGFTTTSLYTYFSGKSVIFHAAARHFISSLEAAFGAIPETQPADFTAFAAEVHARVTALVTFVDAHRETLAFFLRLRWTGEISLHNVRASRDPKCCEAEAPEETVSRMHAHFAAVWRGLGVERFGFEPWAVATHAAAALESYFLRRFVFGLGGSLLEDADLISDLVLYGLRGSR